MKQPISKRAANIKPEYSPIKAPPNPHADKAREGMREYLAQIRTAPLVNVVHEVEPEPPQDDTAALPLIHDRLTSIGKWRSPRGPLTLDASTARIETYVALNPATGEWMQAEVVTVTVFDKGKA